MNNRTKITVSAVLLMSSLLFAQHKPDKDKIKSLKVAFLTERLDMSSKEAQTFWPIYNEYDDKRDDIHEQKQDQVYIKMRNPDNLSEKEAMELIKLYLRFEENEEELDKNFIERISKVISAKKTLLLLRSEYEFKKQLLKQYRNKKDGQ